MIISIATLNNWAQAEAEKGKFLFGATSEKIILWTPDVLLPHWHPEGKMFAGWAMDDNAEKKYRFGESHDGASYTLSAQWRTPGTKLRSHSLGLIGFLGINFFMDRRG